MPRFEYKWEHGRIEHSGNRKHGMELVIRKLNEFGAASWKVVGNPQITGNIYGVIDMRDHPDRKPIASYSVLLERRTQ